jgi:excisionase family DNA binding protein
MTGKLLTVDDLADLLGVSKKTIFSWRARSLGPRGIRVGRHLRFDPKDVETFLQANRDPDIPRAPTFPEGSRHQRSRDLEASR